MNYFNIISTYETIDLQQTVIELYANTQSELLLFAREVLEHMLLTALASLILEIQIVFLIYS